MVLFAKLGSRWVGFGAINRGIVRNNYIIIYTTETVARGIIGQGVLASNNADDVRYRNSWMCSFFDDKIHPLNGDRYIFGYHNSEIPRDHSCFGIGISSRKLFLKPKGSFANF